MWFIFTIKGILCAYFRETEPNTPRVEATALHPPSIANFRIFSGSKYIGFGVNDAAAECSIPWSTGRMDKYPVSASLPWLKIDFKFLKTFVDLSVSTNILSTKSGPGRCIESLLILGSLKFNKLVTILFPNSA